MKSWLRNNYLRRHALARISAMLLGLIAAWMQTATAQAPTTTTVTGTVYLANGQPGSGTLVVSWPAFTTAAGQLVAADSLTVTIPTDGFVSVNLAPNQGATPAGEYYTAVFYMSDGSTSTQYWLVPSATSATLAAVQAQVMPAAQAVQTVSKAYVDEAIAELAGSEITASGGTLTGPLYLSGDPTQPLQAADKHYVDVNVAADLPLNGGTLTGPFTATQIGAAYQVDQLAGADIGAKLASCLSAVSASFGGVCDARNFTGTLPMASNLTIATANTIILLPCATISTANQIIVTAGTRNISLRGCALRGGSASSGSQGGTVFAYTGSAAAIQVGDPTYAVDTPGFHLDNTAVNLTGATSATAQGFVAYRTQELDLESLYFLGNSNQSGMTLDGTGNYTGGTFLDNQFDGFGTAVNAIGHQVSNPATTDWMNASIFVRLHIDCPTSSGSPISGTYGINLQQGDGNTFTGGDVENCATALHLGANAQNNTIVGLRNENSTNQIVADAGSSYNNWTTGGTMFTGKLTDNGTHNSFWDSFHRGFNGVNGDLYRSQIDSTITNHVYLGIGLGNVRGMLDEYITDVPGTAGSYQNAWQWGPGDGTSGQQVWSLLDMLNNVQRFGVQQNTTAGGSPQSYLNAAGTGIVCFQCSTNAGTGGVAFSSGGASPATVATISNAGNAQFNGTLQVGGTAQSAGTMTVRNNVDAEVDYYLWPGLTTSQKGSFTYKDWNGNSQWYMLKDASNNWALNSAVGGLDSFKAYQSTNSGDTYIDASNSTGHIRLNYESGSGAETDIYSGSSSSLIAVFQAPTSIKFPGLAASSGTNCLQVDTSGDVTNTGSSCGSGGGGGGSGTVNSGTTSQIAFYSASGTAVSGNAATVSSAGAGAFVGLEDTAAEDVPSYLESGSDEGTRLENAISGLISSPGAGRAVSETVPSKTTAVTWVANPFASLLNTNGSVNNSNIYQLKVKVQPWQQVTADAEIDMGLSAAIDCADVFGIYPPWSSTNVGGMIQPESSGYPTTTLITDGPSTGATGNTTFTQGNKVTNCALYAGGLTGMIASVSATGGSGMTPGTYSLSFSGGGGSGAAGTITVLSATTYSTPQITSAGSGYASAPAVSAATGGTPPTLTASVSGMTALNLSWGQEGTQARNLRITDFQIGINRDANSTSGGAMHNFGVYDTEVEEEDNTDSESWGYRIGYNSASAENGVAENISLIGGSNPNGTTKVGLENDASGFHLTNALVESLTYGILNDNKHSAGNAGNSYETVTCNPADAPTAVCAVDGNAGPNYGAIFRNIVSGGFAMPLIFQEQNQPTAAVRNEHGDPVLTSYSYSSAGPVAIAADPQVASVNQPVGVSYGNIAAWPSLYLPAKTNPLTLSSLTTEGAQYMTAADVSGGVIPAGIVHNGDLAAATTAIYHSVAVVQSGVAACIFDGATTADDYVTLSSSTVIGSAVGCHDTGLQTPPSSGVALGKVRKSISAAPSAPSMGTVTTNCTTSCSTTYTYVWVQKANTDPFDLTESAPSSNGTVSSAATLTTSVYNTIPGCSTATSSSPCRLFETAGPHTGFLEEVISTANVLDQGLEGDGSSPFSSGIIAPPVSVRVQPALSAGYASNSAPGLAQCDGTTITCSGSGVMSTAAGTPLTHWSVAGGMMNTSEPVAPALTANDQYAQDVDIPSQVNFNRMCVDVTTDDTTGGDVYNFALVKLTSASCTGSGCATTTVAAWSAATALSSTGPACVANGSSYGSSGNVTLTPGNYYLITTGNATTARIAGTSSSGQKWTALASVAAGTSSSGSFGTITLDPLSSGGTVISGAQTQIALTLTQ